MKFMAGVKGYGWKDLISYATPIAKAATIPFCSMDKAFEEVGIPPNKKSMDLEAEFYKALAYNVIIIELLHNISINGKSLVDYLF